VKIVKRFFLLNLVIFISCLFTNCERNQDTIDITEQLPHQSEGDDISDLIEFWSLMTSSMQGDIEQYNVFELSATLSEDGKVKDYEFNGTQAEVELKYDSENVSFRECTDSKGGKWTNCSAFCKNCSLQATLWLKTTIRDCVCGCFETRTEYAKDKSFTIYFRECL